MSELLTASIREKLWHQMRYDLAHHVPEIAGNQLLMCCACGRLLPQDCFDLEHLIPQQVLRKDPDTIRTNPDTPANVRAGTLLLCKKPLLHKGSLVYRNGCNSWKGRFYDKRINDLVSGRAFQPGAAITDAHIIAALSVAYLAMVAKFGYVVALMPSGLLMRRQFFMPRRFHRRLPHRSQMLLGSSQPIISPDAPIWTKPFAFSIRNMGCVVTARNFGVIVPLSHDPRERFAQHLRIAPAKYILRPDFTTVFT